MPIKRKVVNNHNSTHTLLLIAIFIGVLALILLSAFSLQEKRSSTTKANFDEAAVLNLLKCDSKDCRDTLNRIKVLYYARGLTNSVTACFANTLGERWMLIIGGLAKGQAVNVTNTDMRAIESCMSATYAQ